MFVHHALALYGPARHGDPSPRGSAWATSAPAPEHGVSPRARSAWSRRHEPWRCCAAATTCCPRHRRPRRRRAVAPAGAGFDALADGSTRGPSSRTSSRRSRRRRSRRAGGRGDNPGAPGRSPRASRRPTVPGAFAALDLSCSGGSTACSRGEHRGLRLGPGSDAEELTRYRPGETTSAASTGTSPRAASAAGLADPGRPRARHLAALDETASMAFGTAPPRRATSPTCSPRPWGCSPTGRETGRTRPLLGAAGMRWSRRAGRVMARRSPRRRSAARRGRPGGGGTPATGSRRPSTRSPGGPPSRAADRRHRPPRPVGRTDRPFPGSPPLRRLAARHDVVVVEVLDPRELDLPDVGLVVLVDPETGRQREVWTSPRLRPPYAAAAAAHRGRRCGARSVRRRARPPAHRPRLGPRPRPLHPLPPARAARHPPGGPDDLPVPVVASAAAPRPRSAVAYLLAARRRRRYVVRFAALPMLENLRPARPGGVGTPLPPRSSWPCRPSPSPSHVPRWSCGSRTSGRRRRRH